MIMAATTTAVTISIIKSQTPKGSLKPQIPVSGCPAYAQGSLKTFETTAFS